MAMVLVKCSVFRAERLYNCLMTRRTFVSVVPLAGIAAVRPNVLFSLGAVPPGIAGALAKSAIRFTHCFMANPECPAARSGILSGLAGTRAEATLWPSVMKRAGYRTVFAGTWRGLGKPEDVGFDVRKRPAAELPESPFFLWAEEDGGHSLAAVESSAQSGRTIVFSTVLNCSGAASLRDKDVRVPLTVRVPGLGKAGSTSPNLCYLHDLFPTACELVGLPQVKTDGRSLKRRVRDQVFCAYRDRLRMVRTEKWKLIRDEKTRETQLYDMAADPAETRNLAADPAHRGILAEMERRLTEARRAAGEE